MSVLKTLSRPEGVQDSDRYHSIQKNVGKSFFLFANESDCNVQLAKILIKNELKIQNGSSADCVFTFLYS